ncbi:hypothetical protein [Formosa algae]|uniref:hypothetical protein n=1 Tax=Formosa algae TaxID=225843 RepID=UPI000CCDDADC|nr:hypothetical protein [Formosa algae]PNW27218.1 hypothetical protein BKP44_14085 [Formosa algae]
MEILILCYRWIFGFIVLIALIPILYKYFELLVYYTFSTPYSWKTEIEKPRLFLFCFGIFIFVLSLNMMSVKSNVFVNIISLILGIFSCCIFHFIWTSKFENKFIQMIKKKLGSGLTSNLYNQNTNIDEILEQFPEFDCESDTFKNFLLGNRINKKNKIICSYPKSKLIRFIIIIYDLSNNNKSYHKEIKDICEHYFIKKDGNSYTFRETSGEITDAFEDKKQESNVYCKEQKHIRSTFLKVQ